MSSHVDSKANDKFAKWEHRLYGALKPVAVQRGVAHKFLGMTLDFWSKGNAT